MFAAPDYVQETFWKTIDVKSGGRSERLKQARINFVPLFGTNPTETPNGVDMDEITKSGMHNLPMLGKDIKKLRYHEYRVIVPNEDPATKDKWSTVGRNYRWVHTGWHEGQLTVGGDDVPATISDPAVTLGMSGKDRAHVPVLHGAKPPAKRYAHDKLDFVEIRVPVLWDVQLNSKGHAEPETGYPAMLTLKLNQFTALMEAMMKFTQDETIWRGDKKEKIEQPFIGTSLMAFVMDETAGFNRYAWELEPSATFLNNTIDDLLGEAPKRVEDNYNYLLATHRGYFRVADMVATGKLTREEGERMAISDIAKGLLDLWSEEHNGTVEGILEVFYDVASQYSLEPSAGLAAALDAAALNVNTETEEKPF